VPGSKAGERLIKDAGGFTGRRTPTADRRLLLGKHSHNEAVEKPPLLKITFLKPAQTGSF
jgi:hypothetical protein